MLHCGSRPLPEKKKNNIDGESDFLDKINISQEGFFVIGARLKNF